MARRLPFKFGSELRVSRAEFLRRFRRGWDPWDARHKPARKKPGPLPVPEKSGRCYSDHKGVTFDRQKGRWIARIQRGGKTTKLGTFLSEQEAAEAYQKAKAKAPPRKTHRPSKRVTRRRHAAFRAYIERVFGLRLGG